MTAVDQGSMREYRVFMIWREKRLKKWVGDMALEFLDTMQMSLNSLFMGVEHV